MQIYPQPSHDAQEAARWRAAAGGCRGGRGLETIGALWETPLFWKAAKAGQNTEKPQKPAKLLIDILKNKK